MKTIIILTLLLSITSISYAETYKWEDASGLHFTDNLEKVPAEYRPKLQEKSNDIETHNKLITQRNEEARKEFYQQIEKQIKQNLDFE